MELSISLDEFHSYNWDNWLEEIFLSLSLFLFNGDWKRGREREMERSSWLVNNWLRKDTERLIFVGRMHFKEMD